MGRGDSRIFDVGGIREDIILREEQSCHLPLICSELMSNYGGASWLSPPFSAPAPVNTPAPALSPLYEVFNHLQHLQQCRNAAWAWLGTLAQDAQRCNLLTVICRTPQCWVRAETGSADLNSTGNDWHVVIFSYSPPSLSYAMWLKLVASCADNH